MEQQELSARQFGANAGYYLSSPVHATGADLERISNLARERRARIALDLGCGAGHAAFALARGGALRIHAYDPSPAMLAVVSQEARRRGHDIDTITGGAEELPFATATVDLIVTRYSAHHWADVPRALAECARVLAPGGRLVVIDVVTPETPLLDTALQVVEFLRDASHVRNYRESEWTAMLGAAGFARTAASAADRWRIPMEFPSWVARIGTPPARIAALQTVFGAWPAEARDYFELTDGFSFAIDGAWMEGERAGR